MNIDKSFTVTPFFNTACNLFRTTFAMLFLSLLSPQYVYKILPPLSLSRCFDWAIQNKKVHGMMPRENEKDCPNLLTPAFCLTHNIFPFSSSHPFLQHRINLSVIQIYWTTNHLVHLSKCSTGTILESRKFRIVFVSFQCIEESLTGWICESIKSISAIGKQLNFTPFLRHR